MKTITTQRFVLEPQVAAHASEMFSVLSDTAIYEFENAPPPSEDWLRARYERLESRGPADESEVWLNWVIRLHDGNLAGYAQATVFPDHCAYDAYELNSRYWRRGIGRQAVHALLEQYLQNMHELSPPESVHALDVSRLKAADIAFWTVRDGGL